MGTHTSAVYDEGNATLARPWPRFWARIFDLTIYCWLAAGIVGVVLAAVAPSLLTQLELSGPSSDYLVGLALLPIALFIDALVVSTVGSSPGKAMAGLYVARLDQEKLAPGTALKRNMLLYFRGLIIGLPLICLVGFAAGFHAVKDRGITSWDEETDTRVFDAVSDAGRTAIVAAFAIMAVSISNYISRMP